MFGLGPATKIYIGREAVDMRKGFEGLYGLVRDQLGQDPLSGHLFLFTNRTHTRLKALVWDGSGLWVCAKRLERGRFRWPADNRGTQRVDAPRRTGDAGERPGSDASAAADELVSPGTGRIKHFRSIRVRSKTLCITVRKCSHLRAFRLLWNFPMSAPDPNSASHNLERELHWAHLKIQVLEERLRQQRIRMLGPHSETLSNLQLELLADEEPGVTRDEVEAEARREPITQDAAARAQAASGPRALAGESAARGESDSAAQEQTCTCCAAAKRRSSATTKASSWMWSRRATSCG